MWFVVQHKPNQGERARVNLCNQGVTCFYPQIYVDKCKLGKRVQQCEALFPGYMFIELGEEDPAWSKIRSTRGVQKVIGFAGRPTPVADGVIAQVRGMLGSLGDRPSICPGQEVCVTEGPFKDLKAVFQSFDGEQRALVLVSFMQQQCSVAMPWSALKV
ncbi:transcription/translation regulatory transformer protein RfaH [Spongiibacter sp.]|uniref:transcription/translation regulatory transformer protein RfaH n=1 Tax=Spongiibacter sp. TaxID=2024860 RepID=UPI003566F114